MYSILELIERSADYLKSKGVESPRLNAELLLANILNCNRMELYLKYDQPLKDLEINKYREFISRRGKREPLQYIIGKVEFYGLNFIVNENVLIPRQETEILIDTVLLQTEKNKNTKILDIGTGSGNIPISLAKNFPHSEIDSIDISNDAIEIAKQNAKINSVEDRINFIVNDFRNFNYLKNQYDLIVSNPPYINLREYNLLEKELLEFEPKIALTDFNDGLSFYKMISQKAKLLLKPKGKIFYEVGISQAESVKNILKENNFINIMIAKDYLGIDRVVVGELN
ncbi:MAG: peptide chain release factor N(5)-glutamine methyltransferase [Ignavibacteriae bacterium]|nr:peptide chain release factor N(5)-glutamine methyltransferase [Ignavibacteriota bacterium]